MKAWSSSYLAYTLHDCEKAVWFGFLVFRDCGDRAIMWRNSQQKMGGIKKMQGDKFQAV